MDIIEEFFFDVYCCKEEDDDYEEEEEEFYEILDFKKLLEFFLYFIENIVLL